VREDGPTVSGAPAITSRFVALDFKSPVICLGDVLRARSWMIRSSASAPPREEHLRPYGREEETPGSASQMLEFRLRPPLTSISSLFDALRVQGHRAGVNKPDFFPVELSEWDCVF
jgi:hypothetical protein